MSVMTVVRALTWARFMTAMSTIFTGLVAVLISVVVLTEVLLFIALQKNMAVEPMAFHGFALAVVSTIGSLMVVWAFVYVLARAGRFVLYRT